MTVRQLVQSVRNGDLQLVEVPSPTIGPTEVLVRTSASLVSPGTERAIRNLARASLLAKARARPDLVRQVVKKARTEGLSATRRAVERRLDDDMPLGYSAAGVAIEVGDAVVGVRPGQRVATGGAGHGDLQVVSGLLAAPLPDGVGDEAGAFATIGAIALHGFRLAEVSIGSKVLVVGMGLVGQLAARIAAAAGCAVAAVDVRPYALDERWTAGMTTEVEQGEETTRRLWDWTGGIGFDAVLVCAATSGSGPIERAVALARDRATVVVVGDVGLELDRRPLYERELTIRVARSYGPGRYERGYEDYGIDLPPGHVRWTEGRNLGAVIDLLARGRIQVDDLITHRFDLGAALDAYALLESATPHLGVVLTYPTLGSSAAPAGATAPTPAGRTQSGPRSEPASGRRRTPAPRPGVGFVGAGAFAAGTLVPAFRAAGLDDFVAIASAHGRSARKLADSAGFRAVAADARAVIHDPAVDLVVVATPHADHAAVVVDGLGAGKHVFCEKPLALSTDELDGIEAALATAEGQLMVGHNRRWSTAARTAHDHLAGVRSPRLLTYRVSAGAVPDAHWYHDRRQGGRLLGEVCHFVDLCGFIVDSPAATVHCTAPAGTRDELLLSQDLVLTISYADGSLATIVYASGGHPSDPKERLEVQAGGHTVVIDDFRSVSLDGRTTRGAQDKGHQAQIAHFRRVLADGTAEELATPGLATMRTTLAAVTSLQSGRPVQLDDRGSRKTT